MRTLGVRITRRSTGVPSVRRGMTLVEMIVALTIIGVGLLALAGSAALVTRLMGGGARQTLAANLVQARLEALRATNCANVTSGTETIRGVVVRWTSQAITRGKSVTVTATYPMARGNRTQTYRTILPC
jgi:prepilin-type N-terminal cleavage/methylation domain-containing protein